MKVARIYRHVECGTWDSADFLALSAPKEPSAQFLWLYLMTGPQTGPIPGLYRLSLAETAERFGWPVESTRDAFNEIVGRGMAAYDAQTRVVWLPKAIQQNRNAPASPNVVKSWRRPWTEIPQSHVTRVAARHIESSLRSIGEAFAEAFREVIGEAFVEAFAKGLGEPFPKGSADPSPNQESGTATENSTKTVKIREDLEAYVGAAEGPARPDLLGTVGGGS